MSNCHTCILLCDYVTSILMFKIVFITLLHHSSLIHCQTPSTNTLACTTWLYKGQSLQYGCHLPFMLSLIRHMYQICFFSPLSPLMHPVVNLLRLILLMFYILNTWVCVCLTKNKISLLFHWPTTRNRLKNVGKIAV